MKIAFVFFFPLGTGGHFNSALSLIRRLIDFGHEVLVLSPGGEDAVTAAFRSAGAAVEAVPDLARWRFLPRPGVVREMSELCAVSGVDLIHAQSPFALAPSLLVANRLGLPCVATLAGKAPRARRPPHRIPVVCYSQELIDDLLRRGRPAESTTTLVRARLDLSAFSPGKPDPSWLARHGLQSDARNTEITRVVTAIRLDHDKRPWLEAILSFVGSEQARKSPMRVYLAGEGPLRCELDRAVSTVPNRDDGEPVLRLIGGLTGEAEMRNFYRFGHLAMGIGRCALEAMACGRATVVIGPAGQGVAVDPTSVVEVSRYNFSGRHFVESTTGKRSLTDVVTHLARDERARGRIADFGSQYVRKNYDATVGARALIDVYQAAGSRGRSTMKTTCWIVSDAVRQLRDRVAQRL